MISAFVCIVLSALLASRTPEQAHIELSAPASKLHLFVDKPTPGTSELPAWAVTGVTPNKRILVDGRLGLALKDEGNLLAGASLIGQRRTAHDERIPVLFGKASSARDRFNELRLQFRSQRGMRIDIVFRCYDDAVALRYEIPRQQGLDRAVITEETTSFAPTGDPTAVVQYCENFQTSHEHIASTSACSAIRQNTLIDTPALFTRSGEACIAITEAGLRKYAGMYLTRKGSSLVSTLAPRKDGTLVVRDTPMATPWRVILFGDRPAALLESDTIYCLNDPPAIADTSWIRPGKMSWSWWNGELTDGVPSKQPILSLPAQKRYIDFCAKNGILYHSTVADEDTTPWYHQSTKGIAPGPDTDVTRVRDDLDLKAIKEYADSKGVRLWTWVHQAALKGKVEEAFAAFERLGWKGMMIDFFDHDDQETVEHAEAILQAAARHHILIHFHGIWKTGGWQRTYPNLMNHEGVLNLEYLKWSDLCTPEHTLNMVFTRMLSGPMDYHLGGFRAVRREDFKPNFRGPNVLGTRCHQLACYVCIDNPNPMVADYPAAYEGQPGFDFIRTVPTWWDETRVLVGEVGKTLVTARRKGSVWYVGCMTAGPARMVKLPLSFLGGRTFEARYWNDDSKDDPNRLREHGPWRLTGRGTISLHCEADGGFVAELRPHGNK